MNTQINQHSGHYLRMYAQFSSDRQTIDRLTAPASFESTICHEEHAKNKKKVSETAFEAKLPEFFFFNIVCVCVDKPNMFIDVYIYTIHVSVCLTMYILRVPCQ